MRAGFSEIEITPPLGTRKIGWIREIQGDRVLDPLYARAAVFESRGERAAFVQLDTLSVRSEDVADLRARLEARYGFPGARVMVSATHNHAGPAVASIGAVRREDGYMETLLGALVSCFGQALERMEEAACAFAHASEFRVGFNRRVVMRDGTTKTHGRFPNPEALCLEGPVDPEVAVLAVRGGGGAWLGALVNFTCHPAHHGGDGAFSAGWPGKLADELKARGCACPMFLNGAQGNISTSDPERNGADQSMEAIGAFLAEDVARALESAVWRAEVAIGASSRTLRLPFREAGEDEIRGTIRGAQRFIDPNLYDQFMPEVLEKIRREKTAPAELQALFFDEYAFVGVPAELFVELGLRIKERAHPKRALVVGLANGMVGYVPTKEAFARGGYETTFCGWSCLAHEAGDTIADAAVDLIGRA
ncbi:MAG: hypothetical protein KIS92_24425 [Planctomycetota bacterium]|nr:hypothetical protein [Planctomycetota bacterium]